MGKSPHPRAPTVALLWGAPLPCFPFLTHLGQEQFCLRREDRGGSQGLGWSTPPWGWTGVLWREGCVPSPPPLGKSPCRLPGQPEVNFLIKAVGLVRQTAVLASAGPEDEAGGRAWYRTRQIPRNWSPKPRISPFLSPLPSHVVFSHSKPEAMVPGKKGLSFQDSWTDFCQVPGLGWVGGGDEGGERNVLGNWED